MCSSDLVDTKQHEFFDGMYAIRGTIPPRPACGERIEVREACSIRDAKSNACSVCKVTSAYGIGKLHTELTRALSAWLSVGNRISRARCPRFATVNPSCGGLALKSAFGAKRKQFPLFDPP